MKRNLIRLVCAGGLLAVAVLAPVHPAAAQKCASCSDQHKACISFCGSNQINFSCQNNNPCAGTCSCQ